MLLEGRLGRIRLVWNGGSDGEGYDSLVLKNGSNNVTREIRVEQRLE